MESEEAKKLICPYNKENCITENCMFWITTANDKKIIDEKIVPYDMTPSDTKDWKRILEAEGYVNEGHRNGGWREYYVKYEEAYEGYCSHAVMFEKGLL